MTTSLMCSNINKNDTSVEQDAIHEVAQSKGLVSAITLPENLKIKDK